MNLETLERLEANPHYRLNEKQKQELERLRREEVKKPMVEFGVPTIHNTNPELHPTEIKKVKRTKNNK